MLRILQLLFGATLPEPRRQKRRPAKRKRKPSAKFVAGEMEQRVRMIAPDVVEWALVRKKKR